MKILVIVEDPRTARSLCGVLAGERVEIETDVARAFARVRLAEARRTPYDVVLGDRAEVLAWLRARPDSPPCIAIGSRCPTWTELCDAIASARLARPPAHRGLRSA